MNRSRNLISHGLTRRRVLSGTALGLALAAKQGRAQQNKPATALGNIDALAFSPDGSLLAAVDQSHLSIWQLPGGTLLPGFAACRVPFDPITLAFIDKGTSLCIVSSEGATVLPMNATLSSHVIPFDTTAAAISPASGKVAYSQDDTVIVMDIATAKPIRTLDTGLGLPDCLALSADGTYLAAGAHETEMVIMGPAPQGEPSRQAAVFDLATGARKNFLATGTWFLALTFAPDGSRLAAITYDHNQNMAINDYQNTTLNVWDLATGANLLTIPFDRDSTAQYPCLSFVHSNNYLVAAGGGTGGGDMAVVDIANGLVKRVPGISPSFWAAAANPDASIIALGGFFPGVMLLQIPSLEPAGNLPAAGNAKTPIIQ